MEDQENKRFTDKELVKWGVILFAISIYGYLYLKILVID